MHCVREWRYSSEVPVGLDVNIRHTAGGSYTTAITVYGDCYILVEAPTRDSDEYADSVYRLNYPMGVFVDMSGNVAVADTNNHRVVLRGRPALMQWSGRVVEGERSLPGTRSEAGRDYGVVLASG